MVFVTIYGLLELSQSLFMLHYFSSFYSFTLYIAVRNEQMGCRTRALCIIPTLQLLVRRARARLCALELEREKIRWGTALSLKGIPFVSVQANFISWLESLTNHLTVWVSSKTWGDI